MISVLQSFVSANWLSLSLAAVTSFLAYWFFRSQVQHRLFYYQSFYRLAKFGEPHEISKDISITYRRRSYQDIYIHKFCFWNPGKIVLDRDHISKKVPIVLETEKFDIIRIEQIFQTTEAIDFKARRENSKEICLSFDFMNPGEGVVFYAISSTPERGLAVGRAFKLRGEIKGAPKGFQRVQTIRDLKLMEIVSLFAFLTISIGAILIVVDAAIHLGVMIGLPLEEDVTPILGDWGRPKYLVPLLAGLATWFFSARMFFRTLVSFFTRPKKALREHLLPQDEDEKTNQLFEMMFLNRWD